MHYEVEVERNSIRSGRLTVQGIMTILRDQDTPRGDFIFYADRLSTLVVEKALSFIPYQGKSVRTPVGIEYEGMETIEKVRPASFALREAPLHLNVQQHLSSPAQQFDPAEGACGADGQEVVGISILRSGGPFSHGLRRVIRDVPIGSMLIQSDPRTGEPLLLRTDLPPSIKSQESSGRVRVLLLDSQMGTGAAASMSRCYHWS